jgi:hypothetical protein
MWHASSRCTVSGNYAAQKRRCSKWEEARDLSNSHSNYSAKIYSFVYSNNLERLMSAWFTKFTVAQLWFSFHFLSGVKVVLYVLSLLEERKYASEIMLSVYFSTNWLNGLHRNWYKCFVVEVCLRYVLLNFLHSVRPTSQKRELLRILL